MNKKEIINKYNKKLKDLIIYRKKLQSECKKHTSQNITKTFTDLSIIKDDYFNTVGKIDILIQILEDLEKMEE